MPASFIGFGTSFLGGRDYKSDSSYITTEFVTALYFPLIPMRSFRVIKLKSSFRWFGPRAGYSKTEYRTWPVPLCWKQVGLVYATFTLCVASFLVFVAALGNRQNAGPLYDLYSHDSLLAILIVLVPTWPLIVGCIVQYLSKRRAGWKPYSLSGDPAVAESMEKIRQLMKQPRHTQVH